ncbi:unnamed protein product [Allacma fusca]|uniref:Uncharacterized protein n=1 Tax=Allacma fusca TaxID=39272 RepID=A0A8J2L877_9HEXA|nr:unnamed protein product [Allacma fusca]
MLALKDFIVTTEYIRHVETKSPKSSLHHTIEEFFDAGVTNSKLNSTLNELYNSCKTINKHVGQLVYHQKTKGAEAKDSLMPRLLKNHMFVGKKGNTFQYKFFVQKVRKNSLVFQGPDITLFEERTVILIRRNLVSRIFTEHMFHVVESGLYKLWEEFSQVKQNLWGIKQFIVMNRLKNVSWFNRWVGERFKKVSKSRYNIMTLLWGGARFSRDAYKQLALKDLTIVFALFFSGVFLACTFRVAENVYAYRERKRRRLFARVVRRHLILM